MRERVKRARDEVNKVADHHKKQRKKKMASGTVLCECVIEINHKASHICLLICVIYGKSRIMLKRIAENLFVNRVLSFVCTMERWLDCLNCVLTVLATDDNHSAMNTPAKATPSTTYCQKQKRRQLAAANRNQMIPFET